MVLHFSAVHFLSTETNGGYLDEQTHERVSPTKQLGLVKPEVLWQPFAKIDSSVGGGQPPFRQKVVSLVLGWL